MLICLPPLFIPGRRRWRFEATPLRGSLKLPPAAPGLLV
jgi:hypothetical protein